MTTSALAGAAAELGLLPEDPVALRAQGAAEAEEWIGQGWQRSLEVMRDEFPVYLAEFDQILGMAPPAYAPLIQLLYDHEVAFIDFARAALAGQSDAIAVLDRYLEDHPAITT